MTDAELNAIQARCDAATDGPWFARLRELLAEAKTQIHSPHSPTLAKIADVLGESKGGA